MTLQRICKVAPNNEALLRVYKNKVVLNSSSARLLGLTPETLLAICYDNEQLVARGVKRLYIGKAKDNAYSLTKRGETYIINSTSLCRSIADALQGYGTYRVCPEDSTMGSDGNKYYNIFFRKYEKEDSVKRNITHTI